MKGQAEGLEAAKSVEGAKSAAEAARQNKKLAENLAKEAKRLKERDPFTAKPDDRKETSPQNIETTDNSDRDADSEKVARTNRDKARSDADQAKARELRTHVEKERRAAQARANEARTHAAKQRDRDRKIKSLETKLQQLMRELKQLESEDDRAGG
jgi:hypothetical protein